MEHPLRLVRYDLAGADPYSNLAVEEFLARTCPPDTVRLVFSRNAPAVVIGRNQNPWIEADVGEAQRRGIAMARRASGGGAVYHDAGNLNYGFIMPRTLYHPPRFLAVVVAALHALGVEAAACSRSSVWINERKVSGTAFLLTGRTALLHGCILIESDLDVLRRVLAAPAIDLRSRAIRSVRSPVARLGDLLPGLTAEAVREQIAASAVRALLPAGGRAETEPSPAPELVAVLRRRLSSWEWIYARTADFEHVLRPGDVSVTLVVQGATVTAARLAGGGAGWEAVVAGLPGTPYDGERLAAATTGTATWVDPRAAALAACLRREVPAIIGTNTSPCLDSPSSPAVHPDGAADPRALP